MDLFSDKEEKEIKALFTKTSELLGKLKENTGFSEILTSIESKFIENCAQVIAEAYRNGPASSRLDLLGDAEGIEIIELEEQQ